MIYKKTARLTHLKLYFGMPAEVNAAQDSGHRGVLLRFGALLMFEYRFKRKPMIKCSRPSILCAAVTSFLWSAPPHPCKQILVRFA
jgi:hypothetical protein